MKPTSTEIHARAKEIAATMAFSIQSIENALRYGIDKQFTLDEVERLIRAGISVDAAVRVRDVLK